MHRITRALATAALALAACALAPTAARAAAAPVAFPSGPPVAFWQCEAGGGFVATDPGTQREVCEGGEYDNRYVYWL
ncbi:hypothetical protein OHA84_37125 [Streptomyces sp. NBC_00513]|uniref:hypothetical protein n=1 Tax=unclassified Streptomyces TaxID=2593676 RepID=UPI0022501E3F|nr:hypothetical protein [Streptomyces sp. NBC_00424]MCX5078606.1 hypothetical protein [Streptomyces sp. NBC_00424]WUD39052.1 hypothetical protein OHA84_00175 [Streptomyces sp. NBC_00513]WUD45677.1 hypothetical protein OHA84_37125 [Streptomyces sp. NBC_00513]